jgi:hypothetical protein
MCGKSKAFTVILIAGGAIINDGARRAFYFVTSSILQIDVSTWTLINIGADLNHQFINTLITCMILDA